MTIKYEVYPGNVTRKTDGQIHYITAHQLMRLYGVNPVECVVYGPQYWWMNGHLSSAKAGKGLIRLEPRYDGDYTLPQESAK